jgi:hypothetical protein
MSFADVVPVPVRNHYRHITLHHCLTTQPGIQLKIGCLFHPIDLIIFNLRKIVHALFDDHVTGGARAASSTRVFQMEAIVHRDIEQRFGEPVALVGQFARFKFKRLVSGQKSHLGHIFDCSDVAYSNRI